MKPEYTAGRFSGLTEWKRPLPRVIIKPRPKVRPSSTLTRRARWLWDTSREDWITDKQWESIKLRYNHRCAYCLLSKRLTKDHVIPLSKGGKHTRFNIIPACLSCNARKGNRPAERYNPRLFT